MPTDDILFLPYAHVINGIAPRVPHLWTGVLGGDGLVDVAVAYPDIETIKTKIFRMVELIKNGEEDRLVTRTGHDINLVPIEALLKAAPANFRYDLTRDFNGEYAPAIAASLCGGHCYVRSAGKPANIRQTLRETDTKIKLAKCPEEHNEAMAWLQAEIKNKHEGDNYSLAERVKSTLIGQALLGSLGYGRFTVDKAPKGGAVAMNSLHCGWLFGRVPQRFSAAVQGWVDAQLEPWDAEKKASKRRRLTYVWAKAYVDASAKETRKKDKKGKKPKSSEHKVSLEKVNKIKPKKAWVTFFVWVRHQAPANHSHNMGQDLLYEIVSACAHVCEHLEGIGEAPQSAYRFVLFGDAVGTIGDMPVHTGGLDDAAALAIQGVGKAGKATVAAFVADLFRDSWDAKPATEVIDLRGVYSAKTFSVPALSTLAAQNFVNDNTLSKLAGAYCKANARAGNLSYWEQYSLFATLRDAVKPRFMIGAESGNMDGFGYCGVPVVSVDVEDPAHDLDHSILTDRIGQYTFLTPLWDLLNYGRGVNLGDFREYLYGVVLKYTRYGGVLPQPPDQSLKLKGKGTLDEENAALLHQLLEGAFESEAVDETLIALYAVIDVDGDGNCLFRALSRARTVTEDHHANYRQRAVDYAAANYSLVTLRAGGEQWKTNAAYRQIMRVPAEGAKDEQRYGGHVEIAAFAARYNLTVEVYQQGQAAQPIVANPGRPEIVRIYYVNRNHYKVLA